MRVVAEIPHPHLKISIFQWNGKYVIKIEIGQFEQTYKVNETDVDGLESVKAMVSDAFLETVMERFLEMRQDFHQTYQKNNN